ncbi:MAG: homocysteine S-methyltransferase family protein [Planctomycetaceae bacterium]|jgi:methionine synthase I (cobalamin-dependent)|nr:homocysteine S-methyltransferase family protein [Planctomycetaceae bacterium]
MSISLSDWFQSGVLLLDGGWGTQLQLRGLETGAHPDLWNLSQPEKVREVAECYVNAGSDVILTNTFGSTRFPLARHGYENKVEEINRAGVRISLDAARKKADVKVFASIGPSGVVLMMGNVTADDLYAAFLEQAQAIALEQPDGIVVETMSDPAEAVLAVKAAKTTGLPVAACMVFDSGKNKDRTMMGTTPEQAVEQLTIAGADIIGSNCGQGIDGFIPICRRMRAVTDLPIWMKANAGLPEIVDGTTVYRQTPEKFAESAMKLVEAGANFIGGCCGTTPEFVAALNCCRTQKSN